MKRLLLAAVLLLAVAPLTAPTAALAASGGGRSEEAGRESPKGLVPLSRVLETLAHRYPGKQLNTTMGETGGRPAYLVQWQFKDGRIKVITVDAQTGQVVG